MQAAVGRGIQIMACSLSSSSVFLVKKNNNFMNRSITSTSFGTSRRAPSPPYSSSTLVRAQQRPTWLPGLDPPSYLDGT